MLKRLLDNAEAELTNITNQGINHENLDMAFKLVEIIKDCKKIMVMEPQKTIISELETLMSEATVEEKTAIREYFQNK